MLNFSSLLARIPDGVTKRADIESPDEVQLEQDFSRLAYAFLKDRASGLIPYLLGFEVVDREEDGSRAVGIFGFKVGPSYYYVPVFFINNQIKGMDLLFSKDKNLFMPLREAWVNHIVNKQTIQLGQGALEKKEDLQKQFESPNFDFLAVPPKTASVRDTILDGFNTWNLLQSQLVESLDKDAEFQKALAGAVSVLMRTQLPLDKTAEDTVLTDWLSKHGGIIAVNSLMRTLTSNIKFAQAAVKFYPTFTDLYVTKFAAELAPEKQAAKITVTTEVSDLQRPEDKTRLIRDGFVIQDGRDSKEKSEVYDVDYVKHFSNPTQPGVYDVLMRSGGTVPCWVLATDQKYFVVVNKSDKNYFRVEPGALFVKSQDSDSDKSDDKSAYAAADSLSSIQVGDSYVLVNSKGVSTDAFRVSSVVAENKKRVRLYVSWQRYPTFDRPDYGHDFAAMGNTCVTYAGGADRIIELADFTQDMPGHGADGALIVPANWKALKLTADDSYGYDQAREAMFCPGTLTDVTAALNKNAVYKLAVESDGLEYFLRFNDMFVDGRPLNYKTAMVRLVTRYGLGVDAAEEMLKEANHRFKSKRLIKLGQMVGVQFPGPSAPPTGYDQFTGASMQFPQEQALSGQMTGVVPPQPTVQPGFNIGGEAEIDQETSQLAQQAAMSGQKNVFDHSTIGGLSKLYDTSAVVDSYIPDMIKAMDRLGRIIFLFYWKNEEFEERYGSEDLATMEDMLRGVFKSFGDLVLMLKQKAIDESDSQEIVA